MSNNADQFIGSNFSWFTGVVEDVNDPFQMGRARVRCIGYHSDDRGLIKTSDLPWASVMTPIHSASMSGIGMSATGVLPGSWVIGFFRDGPSAQDPIILGTIPSMTSKVDSKKGFSDPAGVYPLSKQLGKPDTPVEARKEYAASDAYKSRVSNLQASVPVATAPTMHAAPKAPLANLAWKSWKIETVVHPSYPKNQVFHSESGHVFEVDDSSTFERTLDFHKSGTYSEIDATGSKTTTIVGDHYTVVLKDEHLYVKGNLQLTVDGNVRQYVKGDYHLEVDGNKTELIHGHRQSRIEGTDHLDANKYLETVGTSLSGHPSEVESNGDLAVTESGKVDTTGTIASVTSKGFDVNFASINLNGNVKVLTGATDSFSVGGGRTVTVTAGIITNIY